MMRNPKVSIIIPVYNGSNYLACAIECALSQTYSNIEVIVVNDGSSDNGKTEEIALSYGERIRYYSKPNGGVSSALNYGIANMTGDYFSWLSHDDVYTSNKIKDSVELLAANNMFDKKCVAFTGGHFIDAKGVKIGSFRKYFAENKMYSGHDVVNVMTEMGTLFGCCMLIPKTAFRDVGCFNELLRYSQDSLMWYKIFLAGYNLVSDNKPNVMCRLHRNQVSHLRKDLFAHDSLVLAKTLAEPLAKSDNTGKVLKKYIKRQTKYQCNETINYLYNYAADNGYLTLKDRVVLNAYKYLGFFRYKAVVIIKKILVCFRH